ncbi:unnamed protein product [Ostreobium quekettii]|uniref:FAS1 domain-containing protein n=1 Tax=Ostreobium quekettii TaxID=121088 RepID=A0A8S1IQ13_9CHLO|nr:unnamed protein product [Ostreobium quekettii]|eukprot:evm.model.scf_504EXC.4 EVM.evm.TU.scf_504EXC.4   scf_504EXC:29417-32853(-)
MDKAPCYLACLLLLAVAAGVSSQDAPCEVDLKGLLEDMDLSFAAQAVEFGEIKLTQTDKKTLFAPKNDAFLAAVGVLPGLQFTTLLTNMAFVGEVIEYHLVPERLVAADLENDAVLETFIKDRSSCGNDTLTVKITDDTVSIEGAVTTATVVEADIEICESIIHIVDTVLFPCPEITPIDFDRSPKPDGTAAAPAGDMMDSGTDEDR